MDVSAIALKLKHMSLISIFRKLSNPSRLFRSIGITVLGLLLSAPGLIDLFTRPMDALKMYYIRGHYAMPIISSVVGMVILFFGVRSFFPISSAITRKPKT